MSTITATSAPIETRLASKSDLAFGVFRILAALMFAMHGTVKLFGWPTGQAAAVGRGRCGGPAFSRWCSAR